MNILKAKKGRSAPLPDGALTSEVLAFKFYGQIGLPDNSDSLAYDPVQKLIAVGTQDGRVKVIGQPGVEALLLDHDKSATRDLQFLHSKGALVRITEAGDLQLWGLEERRLLDSLPFGDPLLSLALMPGTPYLCLGCESGALQFAQLIGGRDEPAVGVCEARGLELLPYELHADELAAEGELTHLSALTVGESQLLLCVHSGSGAVVWDLRHQVCLARASQGVASEAAFGPRGDAQGYLGMAGPARSACWVGTQGEAFATGHEMGHVLVWMLPPNAAVNPPKTPAPPQLVMRVVVSPPEELAMPVRRLEYLEGDSGEGSSSLLIFGGQVLDQPDSLSLASLDDLSQGESHVRPLPWYGMIRGFAVVPKSGALDGSAPAVGVLVLMEGGQMVVFGLPELHPSPLSLPLQELPDITLTRLAASAGEGAGEHAVAADRLRAVQGMTASTASSGGGKWRWIFDGGRPANYPRSSPERSELLYTAHKDGRVRVWGCATATLDLHATVPFDSGGAGAKLKAVSALEVCTVTGILAVAHATGEVRVYQFSSAAHEVASLHLSRPDKRARQEEESGRRQPAGYQRVLRLTQHSSPVQCLALAGGLLACGDYEGVISVTDLSEPVVLFVQKLWEQPVACLAFCANLPEASAPERGRATQRETAGHSRLALYSVSEAGGILAVDAEGGKPLGPRVHPKTPDATLSLALLDEDGVQVDAGGGGGLLLPWANNNSSPSRPFVTSDSAGHGGINKRSSYKSGISSPTSPAYSAASNASDPFHLNASRSQRDGAESLASSEERGNASDGDEDSFLAAAAQEAEARDHIPKRHGLKSLFKDGGHSRHKGERKLTQSKSASESRYSGNEPVSRGPHQAAALRTDGSSAHGSFRSRDGAASERSSQKSLASAAADSLGEAAYVVVATTAYIRLYSAESLLSGERTTLRKVTLEEPLCVAHPLTLSGASGLACISTNGHIQVLSLPGLQAVLSQPLKAVLGFSWAWDPTQGATPQRLCSIGSDGQVVAPGKGWEVVRFTLAHSGSSPPQCAGLYDWDLAKAAEAAAVKAAKPRKAERQHSLSEDLLEDEDSFAEAASQRHTPVSPMADHGLKAGTTDHKRGLGGFLNHVRGGVVGVGGLVEGTSRGIGGLVGDTGRGIGKGFGSILGGRRDEARGESPPTLDRLLSQASLTAPTGAGKRPPRGKSDEEGQRGVGSGGHMGEVAEGRRGQSRQAAEDGRRSELLGGRERRQPARRGPRTADEIKEAYGRPATRKAESVGAMASENRAKLAERGEQLSNLNNKAEEMANDAMDFATIARKIRDKEANRKWWQL